MSVKKTLLGLIGIPLAAVFSYSAGSYLAALVNGEEAHVISLPNERMIDPYVIGMPAAIYSLMKKYERGEK